MENKSKEYSNSNTNILTCREGILNFCKENDIPVMKMNCHIPWSELKLNGDGMIPVIVQDAENQDVLMLAYMNQLSYEFTMETGLMTYWSRSRNELWTKGLTSGHLQYLQEMKLDCDNDTILVKVQQVGAACHTGSRTCFFQEAAKRG